MPINRKWFLQVNIILWSCWKFNKSLKCISYACNVSSLRRWCSSVRWLPSIPPSACDWRHLLAECLIHVMLHSYLFLVINQTLLYRSGSSCGHLTTKPAPWHNQLKKVKPQRQQTKVLCSYVSRDTCWSKYSLWRGYLIMVRAAVGESGELCRTSRHHQRGRHSWLLLHHGAIRRQQVRPLHTEDRQKLPDIRVRCYFLLSVQCTA